jgi:hypothetical protein
MDPITISMAIAALGKILGGFGAFGAGKAQNKLMQMGARQASQEAAVQANIALDEGERVSAQAATLAAGGGGITGSALDVLNDLGRQSAFNARSALYAGETEAKSRLYQGQVAAHDGKMALITSVIEAGSSFLGGTATHKADQADRASAAGRLPSATPSSARLALTSTRPARRQIEAYN